MGKLVLNGKEYLNGVSINSGVFIDTNNLIHSTTWTSEITYVATQDCYVIIEVDNATNNSGYVTLDNVTMGSLWSTAWNIIRYSFPVRKGQTVYGKQTDPNNHADFKAYGLQHGDEIKVVNNNGLYFDANNVIVPTTTYTTEFYYTATQDCFIHVTVDNNDENSGYVTIDGIYVGGLWSEKWNLMEYLFPLKKGQTLHAWQTDPNYTSNYSVYGVQAGSIANVQHNYSTSEQVIGTWIDGTPLYEKTVQVTSIPNNNMTDTAHGISNIDVIADISGTLHTLTSVASNNTWTQIPRIQDNATNENIGIEVNDTNIRLKGRTQNFAEIFDKAYVTIQYTKTTD